MRLSNAHHNYVVDGSCQVEQIVEDVKEHILEAKQKVIFFFLLLDTWLYAIVWLTPQSFENMHIWSCKNHPGSFLQKEMLGYETKCVPDMYTLDFFFWHT